MGLKKTHASYDTLSYVSPSCISLRSFSPSCCSISHILSNLPKKYVEKTSALEIPEPFMQLHHSSNCFKYMYNCTLRMGERRNGHRQKECLYPGESRRWVRVIRPPPSPAKIKCIHQKVFLFMQRLSASLKPMKLTLPFVFRHGMSPGVFQIEEICNEIYC